MVLREVGLKLYTEKNRFGIQIDEISILVPVTVALSFHGNFCPNPPSTELQSISTELLAIYRTTNNFHRITGNFLRITGITQNYRQIQQSYKQSPQNYNQFRCPFPLIFVLIKIALSFYLNHSKLPH